MRSKSPELPNHLFHTEPDALQWMSNDGRKRDNTAHDDTTKLDCQVDRMPTGSKPKQIGREREISKRSNRWGVEVGRFRLTT
jgi:hypothetical protein